MLDTAGPTAAKIHTAPHAKHLAALPLTTQAFGVSARALITVITTLTTEIATMQDEIDAYFRQHPDAEIYLSQPGLGTILTARVLAEFGDDPDRYPTGKPGKTTPERHPSPAHPAPEQPFSPVTHATAESATRSSNKRSPRSPHPPALAPATTP